MTVGLEVKIEVKLGPKSGWWCEGGEKVRVVVRVECLSRAEMEVKERWRFYWGRLLLGKIFIGSDCYWGQFSLGARAIRGFCC